ncbi:imelysin family protein [Vibrio gallaecicus]|uniref:imelysin family protein n=1 Tax=Vibrio gallaecicus TaxID=552386 RepID=UPI0010C99A7F|nr:imelysin family protein [Vibrio gallaecicus]MDN3613735.1 imelysin family protein [Vibrio gallaecicus]
MSEKLFALPLIVAALAGCQSTNQGEATSTFHLDETKHVSHEVYVKQFESAVAFNTQAKLLEESLGQYCRTNDYSIDAVKMQWHQTMLAWMALQGQERGPAEALQESWNIQFWPDKKNTTGLKMSQLTRQDKTWTQAEIAQQSVTVQGLGALEWMLYDEKSPLLSEKSKGCMSAVAISQNLSVKSTNIADAWQVNPWVALDESRWESEYVALLTNQLDYSMKKLSRPLANIGKPRPYFAESWRSETSLSQLKANTQAMQSLYLAEGKGLDNILRERGLNDLADRVKSQFEQTLATWLDESSLFSMLQSKEGYRNVLAQYNKLERLKYLIHEEVAIELGIVIGFNATDGD